jgi:hypothetical protein
MYGLGDTSKIVGYEKKEREREGNGWGNRKKNRKVASAHKKCLNPYASVRRKIIQIVYHYY